MSAVVIEGLSKRFRLHHEHNNSLKATLMRGRRARYEEFWALRDVSFEIPTGKTFGLIGENGSGKSTLLKCIGRILQPDEGRVRADGRIAALLELGSGFHPELSGRENVFLNGSILGMSRRELTRAFDDIVGFAGLERFIDQPVKNYSSGMYVRLGFAIAINVDPDILLVDEVLAVGDAAFQRKCEEKFYEFRRAGKTVVVVSHAMGSMRQLCDEVAWLEHGRLREVGRGSDVVDDYSDDTRVDAEQTADGGTRWGSGEVRVGVTLLGRDGAPTTRVRTGDPVTFRVSWTTGEPVRDGCVGLAIETYDGVYLWAHNSRAAGPVDVSESGHVDLVVDGLMLQPGGFDVSVSVVDHDTTLHVYDYVKRALRFEVDTGRPREDGGYVALGGRWVGAGVAAPAAHYPRTP